MVIIPALGGKIAALEMGGREWLWATDAVPRRRAEPGATFAEAGDNGGYDECFPTVGRCTIPSWVARYGNVDLPDRGELWSQPTSFALETLDPDRGQGSGLRATSEWRGQRLPYRFRRVTAVDADGTVAFRYAVTNEGSSECPFSGRDTRCSRSRRAPASSCPRMRSSASTRSTASTCWVSDRSTGGHGCDCRREKSTSRGLSRWRRYACKLFLDVSVGAAALEEDGVRLDVSWSAAEIPNIGLWLNRCGWAPLRRRQSECNLSLSPCIGAPDTLNDALGAWKGAHWIEAGATREWSLTWRASRGRVAMADLPFTQSWADALRASINASHEYAAAAGSWTWPVALAMDPAPALGYPDAVAILLDLRHGECRAARALSPSALRAPFVVRGDYATWKEIMRGALDPVTGIMRKRLRLAGSLATLIMHVRAAKALVACAASVPTIFPDEPAPAA